LNATARTFVAGLALCAAGQAMAAVCRPGDAPTDCAPPPGALLDLDGQPTPTSFTRYSASFVATGTTTLLTFAFRDDPGFMDLDDVVVAARDTQGNLVTNGGFEGGDVAGAPTGWAYLNPQGASDGGAVTTDHPHDGTSAFHDGAVGAYDQITQAIETIVGQTYDLSFFLDSEADGTSLFHRLDTGGFDEGGDAQDLPVYVGSLGDPATVPEPTGLALFGGGATTLLATRRRIRPA
jgi:hypothetical protein